MFTFEQLVAFRAVVRAGGFTRAADEMFLTQSALSQRIQHLEVALGTRLFCHRGGRRAVELTEAGERVLAFADDVLARAERLRQEVRGPDGLKEREALTILCFTSPANHILPALLSAFHERHAEVRVNVVLCNMRDINARVRNGEAGLGVQIGYYADHRFVVVPLVTSRSVLIAAPGHPVLERPRKWLAQVRRCPFIALPSDSYTREVAANWAADLGIELDIVIETNSSDVLRRAVMSGLGLGVVSELAVAEDVAAGRLAIVSAPGMPRELQFCLIADANRTLSPAGRALLDLARSGAWRANLPQYRASSDH